MLLLLAFQGSPQGSFATVSRASRGPRANKRFGRDAPALYQRALQMKPDWKDGWWALGGIYYQKDKFTECAAAFEKLAALDHSAPSHAMLGLCQYNLKNYDAATENLAKAQKLGLMNEGIGQPSMYTLAKLWTKRGNFEAALSILFDFAQLGKENPAYVELKRSCGPSVEADVPGGTAGRGSVKWCSWQARLLGRRRNAMCPGGAREFRRPVGALSEGRRGVHYLAGSFELFDSSDRAVEMFEDELTINPNHVGALMALGSEYLRQGQRGEGSAVCS